MATQIGTFDYDNARYKCCCANCHSTVGVKVVAIVHLGMIVFNMLAMLSGRAGGNAGNGSGSLGIVLGLVCVGCSFYALHSGTAALLIPHMVLLAIYITAFIVGGLCIMVMAVVVDPKELQNFIEQRGGGENQFGLGSRDTSGDAGAYKVMVFLFGLVSFAATVLIVWLFLVFLAAYRFLREKALAGYTGGQPMVTMPAGQPYRAQQYAPQGYAPGYVAPPPAYGQPINAAMPAGQAYPVQQYAPQGYVAPPSVYGQPMDVKQ